ncbi:MAG: adenylyl-sulfate kinase [Deltaproteobacteria bacterium]|nr:adenylyl-sulfate kinase [Deltaproteobacteria bacterium]
MADARRAGAVVWLTGLPCAGKTTLCEAVAAQLVARGERPVLLDGDALRRGISADLGFSPADRATQAARVAFVARCVAQAGGVALVGLVSPYDADRKAARAAVARFLLVHVATPLSRCEARDVKGHYGRARAGEIAGFTGVSAPYEAPDDAEVTLRTEASPEQDAAAIVAALAQRGWLGPA